MSEAPAPAGPTPQAPPPRAHHLEVPRTARYYTVVDSEPARVRAVWLAVHGYGQLAGYFARHFAPHAAGRLVVAPEALSRFYLPSPNGRTGGAGGAARVGATWMTREDRLNEIGDYVRYLDRALDAATEAAGVDLARAPIGVLAFSQGTATACRWAAHRHANGLAPVARLVLWGGTVPHDVDLAGPDGDALRAARLTLVAGDADEFATPEVVARESDRLTAAGVPHDIVRYPGGHRLDDTTLTTILAV